MVSYVRESDRAMLWDRTKSYNTSSFDQRIAKHLAEAVGVFDTEIACRISIVQERGKGLKFSQL